MSDPTWAVFRCRCWQTGVGYAWKGTAATPEGSGFTSGAVALGFCLLSRLLQMLLCRGKGDVNSWSMTGTGCTGAFSLPGLCSVQNRRSCFVFVCVALAGLDLIMDHFPSLLHLTPIHTFHLLLTSSAACLAGTGASLSMLPVYSWEVT